MSEKLYKMGDVAKLHGITKKTLRYYDKIDLFKPDKIDGINNYKYYSRVNFPILKQIIYLKDIGFSLDEIRYLLENRTHDSMISNLERRKKEVELEIAKMNATYKSLNHLLDFYKMANEISENDLNKPSIKILPESKVVQIQSEEFTKSGIMLAYRKLLNSLRDQNSFSHQPYGTVYFTDNNDVENAGAFIELPDFHNVISQYILPFGKYITMYHKGSYISQESLEYFLHWIHTNGYKIDSPIYDQCIIDKSFTKDEDNMILEIRVKVKSN